MILLRSDVLYRIVPRPALLLHLMKSVLPFNLGHIIQIVFVTFAISSTMTVLTYHRVLKGTFLPSLFPNLYAALLTGVIRKRKVYSIVINVSFNSTVRFILRTDCEVSSCRIQLDASIPKLLHLCQFSCYSKLDKSQLSVSGSLYRL